MPAQRYRKRPVEVEAVQFTHPDPDIARWCGGRLYSDVKPSDHTDVAYWIDIPTLEGVMRASLGDWIVRGVVGEFYPVKPGIFDVTFEAVTP